MKYPLGVPRWNIYAVMHHVLFPPLQDVFKIKNRNQIAVKSLRKSLAYVVYTGDWKSRFKSQLKSPVKILLPLLQYRFDLWIQLFCRLKEKFSRFARSTKSTLIMTILFKTCFMRTKVVILFFTWNLEFLQNIASVNPTLLWAKVGTI